MTDKVSQNGTGYLLKRGDKVLLEALAVGESLQDAAKMAGVSRKTVQRRKADPAFMAEVYRIRRSFTDQTVGLMASSSRHAVQTLYHLLGASESDYVQLSAAKALLTQTLKWIDAGETEIRLSEVEKKLEEMGR